MALKLKLDKAAFDKLSDVVKAEYYEKDGEYHLDVDGLEDTGALRRSKDHEVKARKEAETKVRDLEEQVTTLTTAATESKAKFDKELSKQLGEKEGQLTKANQFIQTTLVDSVATKIAGEISTAPALLVPHIKARLQADLTGDAPATKVLGADGKVSELTVDALKAEFVANKDFSAIIRGNKASGAGGPKHASVNGGAGSNNDNPSDKPANLATMNPRDLAARLTAQKAEAENQ
uniref:Scaffold protein n=1 Tax=Pseudomonas phage Pavpe01 TaxID=3138545 RepID=A0AAU6W049_9VIRU